MLLQRYRVHEGDVSRDELKAAAQRVVTALETAYGKKLPDVRKNLERPGEKDHGIPTAFDTMVGDANECRVACGAVGSMVITVEYAEPRYALRDGKYELVFKGGVRLSIPRGLNALKFARSLERRFGTIRTFSGIELRGNGGRNENSK